MTRWSWAVVTVTSLRDERTEGPTDMSGFSLS